MKHCINRLFLQKLLDSIRICDVSLGETKPRILAVLRKVLPPTRIGQLVQHHYPAYPGHQATLHPFFSETQRFRASSMASPAERIRTPALRILVVSKIQLERGVTAPKR